MKGTHKEVFYILSLCLLGSSTFLTIFFLSPPAPRPAEGACTSFCLDNGGNAMFGANYDNEIWEGMLFGNKGGVTKTGYEAGTSGKYARWTAENGSVTFNLTGIQLAWEGMNEASPPGRELAANSYNMYLVHYVFVMTIPLILSAWVGGPTLLEFGIVALTTILLSYGISRFLLKPFPRLVVMGLVGLNVLLAAPDQLHRIHPVHHLIGWMSASPGWKTALCLSARTTNRSGKTFLHWGDEWGITKCRG